MTSGLRIGLTISLAVHLILLLEVGGGARYAGSGREFVTLDLPALGAVSGGDGASVALEASLLPPGDENQAAQKKRQALTRFLEEVHECVHLHRFDSGGQDLIGIATFEFTINAEGYFEGVRLRISSGNRELDLAARRAIDAASGVIKRPDLIGPDPLSVIEEVRYQYALP